MKKSCYMCNKEATTVEHVPPQCLFPASKDLPAGVNLRKNLITVPSCKEHNNSTSKDDEYLMYTLVINLPTNGTAFQQFSTKVTRAISSNSSLIKRLLYRTTPLVIEDTESGERFQTIGYEINSGRFCGALEKVARGLYFHHFKKKWVGAVNVYPEFLLSLNQAHSLKTNDLIKKLSEASEVLFQKSLPNGENADVFVYRVYDDEAVTAMRLSFYGQGNVTVVFMK